MSDAKSDEKAHVKVKESPVENKPVEKADAEPEVAASAAQPHFQPGEPVEAVVDGEWKLGVYKSFFPQYAYHTVNFADGTQWTGGNDDIREPQA